MPRIIPCSPATARLMKRYDRGRDEGRDDSLDEDREGPL